MPVTSVDALCNSAVVDLVKIDVEGFEDKVLIGMKETLASTSPTVIFECNPDGPSQVIESLLVSFGYQLYHLRDEGPVPVKSIEPDLQGNYRNFLATVSPIGSQAK